MELKSLVNSHMNKLETFVCFGCQKNFYLATDEKPIIKNNQKYCGKCGVK